MKISGFTVLATTGSSANHLIFYCTSTKNASLYRETGQQTVSYRL